MVCKCCCKQSIDIFLIPEYSQYIVAIVVIDVTEGHFFLFYIRATINFNHFLKLEVCNTFAFSTSMLHIKVDTYTCIYFLYGAWVRQI